REASRARLRCAFARLADREGNAQGAQHPSGGQWRAVARAVQRRLGNRKRGIVAVDAEEPRRLVVAGKTLPACDESESPGPECHLKARTRLDRAHAAAA